MVIFEEIIQSAIAQNKNILIIGSPRSGSHVLGSELAAIARANYLGEICCVSDRAESWQEINSLYNTKQLTVGQIVQLTPKIQLSKNLAPIKDHAVIVNIRRRDKIKQFASWIYFRVMDPTKELGWHNHAKEKTSVGQHSIEAKESDILQFMLEQLIDDYFLPDFNLCYENLTFSKFNKFKKNEFAFPLEEMFSNLDYVKKYLVDWDYHINHFKNG